VVRYPGAPSARSVRDAARREQHAVTDRRHRFLLVEEADARLCESRVRCYRAMPVRDAAGSSSASYLEHRPHPSAAAHGSWGRRSSRIGACARRDWPASSPISGRLRNSGMAPQGSRPLPVSIISSSHSRPPFRRGEPTAWRAVRQHPPATWLARIEIPRRQRDKNHAIEAGSHTA